MACTPLHGLEEITKWGGELSPVDTVKIFKKNLCHVKYWYPVINIKSYGIGDNATNWMRHADNTIVHVDQVDTPL